MSKFRCLTQQTLLDSCACVLFSIRFIPIIRRLKRKCKLHTTWYEAQLITQNCICLKVVLSPPPQFHPTLICLRPTLFSQDTTATHNHHLAIVLKKANNKCHTLVTYFAVSHHLTS